MSRKLKIGVLMGGLSSEHEVSLATGRNVLDNLDKSKYDPISLLITKDKKWFVNGKQASEQTALKNCDLVFNALHGTFGEDGRAQALMEYYNAKYTGSGVTASALAMDKLRSREIFKLAGLNVPKTLKIRRNENYQALLNLFVSKVTNFPVVVKPCSNGSSVGVSIVMVQSQLGKAIKTSFDLESKILIEEFVDGREVTCGVLDFIPDDKSRLPGVSVLAVGSVIALPVTEVILKRGHKFFDYNAKYKTGHTDEITPARLDEEKTKQIQEIAAKAHQLLGCRGYSRTDMIVKDGGIYVLEINTLPGLTQNSLLPKAAQAAGLTFDKLLNTIINSSLV